MQSYSQKEELLDSINEKRQMMVKAAEIYGYTGDETIKRSQELDQLIYQYQKMTMNETHASDKPLPVFLDTLILEKYTA
ncbi:transcriptional regulator [Bacillus glycinifermentans]|uniref:Aspartyl-phosphate phosphatase Spo0E family protein n=1 Tax=Bacillus glycinifermentans TaxID=1664069 RepID=A0A0J6HG23_9BACI|nr:MULTISPECIES: aspartyl-phosphate phosphatase Spo0E family protein [Bacillus]ATH95292.1 aspartyl-phosphate phosphatase Spo0E family protein [Bacillus glycinifermentans]KKB72265.1 transcriptional regulator [Bacillus sp. TH008]KMM58092.1 transcriptional regulator [Bacillus glycinifermentans]KRT91443.1 transcriptional regulator [Bacillus glycinifermentans]MDU0073324.1 aspartyl-phosphate phosphatase Spo0E family protein [Bacillus sp. IG6]